MQRQRSRNKHKQQKTNPTDKSKQLKKRSIEKQHSKDHNNKNEDFKVINDEKDKVLNQQFNSKQQDNQKLAQKQQQIDETEQMLQNLLGFSSFGTSKYKKHQSVQYALKSSHLKNTMNQFITRKPRRSDKMQDATK